MYILKNKIIAILIFSVVLAVSSCKTAEPQAPVIDPPEELLPGSRDYEWTVDTIALKDNYGMTPMRMWASSPSDVWSVGSAYSVVHMIWHYDGVKWKTDSVYRNVDPMAIWGDSKNSVWIGNLDGSFWHYNGGKLNLFCQTQIDSSRPFKVQWIDGSSANDIYAVGFADNLNGITYKAIIMHYNGLKWELVDIPYLLSSFSQIVYNPVGKNYIIKSWYFEKPGATLYSFDGKNLKNMYESKKNGGISMIGNRVYYNDGEDLYKYDDSTFRKILSLKGTNYIGGAVGKSEKDFFTFNRDGIGHYNGTDLVTLWKKPEAQIWPSFTVNIQDDVFSVWQGFRTDTTYFVHGKLKKKGG